jgi:peroxiredoxin
MIKPIVVHGLLQSARRGAPFAMIAFAMIAFALASFSCSGNEASVDTLTKPIPTASVTPKPVDPKVTDLERVKVGMEPPDFSLTDQDGRTVRLLDFRGRKHVVLVFYRGSFCPVCIDQIGKLKSLLSDAEKKNVQVLAVSIDSREDSNGTVIIMSKYPGKADFPLLEDRNHEVIDSYGLYNPDEFKPGIPYPTTYIINKDGRITHRFVDPKTYERASNEKIRGALVENGAV